MTLRPGRVRALALTLIAMLAIAGCGSSGVKPNAYVKSVCVALGSWRNTIQSAGVALQSSGATTASLPVAKLDYQRFVSSLVTATKRTTDAIRAAGTPSVTRGEQIAQRLTRGFDRATRGLAAASAQANAIPTDSESAFRAGASAVDSQIKSALGQIAGVSPGQNRELRSAAAKEPACQLLAG